MQELNDLMAELAARGFITCLECGASPAGEPKVHARILARPWWNGDVVAAAYGATILEAVTTAASRLP